MAGRLEFEFRLPKAAAPPSRRQDGDAFRILVVGDFGGAALREADSGLRDRAVIPVDIDSFEQVLARLAPRLTLGIEAPDGGVEEIAFTSLDDFHPDTLFAKLEVFDDLRQLRERLLDADSFEEAAASLARDTAASGPPATSDRGAPEASEEETGTIFERLLGGRPAADDSGPASPGAGYATQLIERLAEPHIERGADPDRQRLLVAAVDEAIADRMRVVLHDPGFQALEASWRSLWWLVSSLETGAELQIHLLDASRGELAADLEHADDGIETTALYRRLVGGDADTPGGQPWSLLIGIDRFGADAPDLALLAALGTVASHAGGPFLAEANPALLGARSLAAHPDPTDWAQLDSESERRWNALRRAPVAQWLGLALPRVLLRLPYGSRSDPIERFAFEEAPGAGGHEALLWGSPAIACALLLGQSFLENGWDMEPGDRLDLDDLPAFTITEDGETKLKPCAEVLLSHRTGDAIMARGFMPVLSHRDRNAVRFARIQSIADPPAALSGPWR